MPFLNRGYVGFIMGNVILSEKQCKLLTINIKETDFIV